MLKVVSCIYFLSNISMTLDVIFVSLTLVRLGFLKLVSSEEGVKLTPLAPPPPILDPSYFKNKQTNINITLYNY